MILMNMQNVGTSTALVWLLGIWYFKCEAFYIYGNERAGCFSGVALESVFLTILWSVGCFDLTLYPGDWKADFISCVHWCDAQQVLLCSWRGFTQRVWSGQLWRGCHSLVILVAALKKVQVEGGVTPQEAISEHRQTFSVFSAGSFNSIKC